MAVRRGLDFLRVNEKRHVACSSKWYHRPLPNDFVKLLKNLHHPSPRRVVDIQNMRAQLDSRTSTCTAFVL